MVICSDQCVPYGTRSVGISGRILADDGSPSWNAYNNAANGNTFARGNEHEWAQWQLSYDNSSWYDINGATQASYAPGIITQAVTYYRRLSTHIEHHWYGDSREDWYTSNTVTITSGPATPTAAKSYTTCGSGPIAIAVNNAANATSYNWYSVDPAWDINGQGRFQNNTGTSVQITPPANVAAGTYTFNVVANGNCTQATGTVTVTVDPNATTPAPTSYAYVDATPNKTCRSIYNLATPVINGVTSYTATINGRTVTGFANLATRVVTFSFRLPAPQYGVVATITVTGNCAPATFTTGPDDLEDYGNPNGCATPLVADAPEAASAEKLAVYPNPAANQVVLQGSGQVVEVSFYDAEGQCRKTVKLREEDAETAVNILDLPAGHYHLRMVADGKLVTQKQLIIER